MTNLLQVTEFWLGATPESTQREIDQGADVNEKNQWGFSALMYASTTSNKTAVVQTLIDNGADVEIKDKWGKTSHDYLKQNKHFAIEE